MSHSMNTRQHLPLLPEAWVLWLRQQIKPLESLNKDSLHGEVMYHLGQLKILQSLETARLAQESDDESGWPTI